MTVLPRKCPPGMLSQILLSMGKLLAVDMETDAKGRSHCHTEDDIAHTWVHVVGKNIPDDEKSLYDFNGGVSHEVSHSKGLVGATD